MKSRIKQKSQNGAVTILTALVLLIGITLITLLVSKTVLVQMQIAADNQRMTQAVAAANAALDFGIGYFADGGFDHDHNDCPDYLDNYPYQNQPVDHWSYVDPATHTTINCPTTPPRSLTYKYKKSDDDDDDVEVTIGTGTVTFDTRDGARRNQISCVAEGETPNMKSGLIIAVGYSDDSQAQRTISQCVGSISVLGNSPKQSLIARSGVGLTGNFQIINRYYNTTAWSGSAVNIGASSSASTYLRPVHTREGDYTRAQLEDDDITNAYTSQPVSDRDKGNGVDIIANDPGLASLTGDQFFNNFFFSDRTAVKDLAQSLEQVYPASEVGSAADKSGMIWIDGNAAINGGTYGTSDSPAIIIIDGNLRAVGSPEIFGLLYVRGQLDAAGTVKVLGSVVIEGDHTLVPAGEDPVIGHGGVDLIYSPYTLDRTKNPILGTTTAISGSWRDW